MYCFKNLHRIVGDALNVAVSGALLSGEDNNSLDEVKNNAGMLEMYVKIFDELFKRELSDKHTVTKALIGIVPFYMQAHYTLLIFDMHDVEKPMIYELDSMKTEEVPHAR